LLVVAAIACYAMTLAPITWVVLSEIFPMTFEERACPSVRQLCGPLALC